MDSESVNRNKADELALSVTPEPPTPVSQDPHPKQDESEIQTVQKPVDHSNSNLLDKPRTAIDISIQETVTAEGSYNQAKTINSPAKFEGSLELCNLSSLCETLATTSPKSSDESNSAAVDSIMKLLITDDMSTIKSPSVLKSLFVNHLRDLPTKVVSELLSILIAIVKKSVFHLELTRGLLIPCINHLVSETKSRMTHIDKHSPSGQQADILSPGLSLTKHFLREWINLLIAHSCTVEELKNILKLSEIDPSLMNFIQQANTKQRNRPPAFFAFPGTRGSMMSLPPFQKWPIQLGWSFSTWLFLEPKACTQPYLFNFKTGKSGLGYSAHFTGNCLVLTSIKVKGKGIQHCVAYEFPSFKWIHCAITYHNRWRVSEIKVYINGQLSANIDMPWQVQTTEIYDKCFIGGSNVVASSDRLNELNCFCGQMSAIYLFNEGLSPAQICAIHRLGPSYMGQFKYSNESHVNLPPQIGKALYEEKLASNLFCLFTPNAVDSATLCIQMAPFKSSTAVSAQNYFVSAPHAALLGQTKAIITQPICSTLQSLGCSRSLLPLLDAFAKNNDPDACSSLIGFLCDLLESSPHWFANEIVQNNGFIVIACALSTRARSLISEKLLDIFLKLTRTLLTTSSTMGDSLLLKHLMDNILFNPSLWIYADTSLQIKLYSYLATEFLHGTRQVANKYTASNSSSSSSFVAYNPTSAASLAMSQYANQGSSSTPALSDEQPKTNSACPSNHGVVTDLFNEIRRVSTVLQSLHALKYYYWRVEEKGINPKARDPKLRPNDSELTTIRSYILLFTKELILRANGVPLDEMQGVLNYLSTCHNQENLLDVLDMLTSLLREHPASTVAALDQKQGVKVIFSLIGLKSEAIRVKALKLLGQFLAQCSNKKKQEIMGPNNLFMLLLDRLRVFKPLSSLVYEALLEILLESDQPVDTRSSRSWNMSKSRIENSIVLKVIATLLHEEKLQRDQQAKIHQEVVLSEIRSIFINDLWNLVVCSKENRRTILQMSVWQHWLINLIDSTVTENQLIRDQVLAIFRVLLYHAIRYEYGGWRVWIDTLAIIHTKVSYDEFYQRMNLDVSVLSGEVGESENKCSEGDELVSEVSKEKAKTDDCHKNEAEANDDEDPVVKVVSSICERIPNESCGIKIEDDDMGNESRAETQQAEGSLEDIDLGDNTLDETSSKGVDTTDIAPTRAFRRLSLNESQADIEVNDEITHHESLTSIQLDEPSIVDDCRHEEGLEKPEEPAVEDEISRENKSDSNGVIGGVDDANIQQSHKATASPAFRIPEFRWGSVLVKLLNDLMFSIECDLYHWRCMAKCMGHDTPVFTPRSAASVGNLSSNHTTGNRSNSATSSSQIEAILQKAENQIYLINIVHFVSQLADNIIIAAGGLLPLLADATGGSRATTTAQPSGETRGSQCEGLALAQANSLLYRLTNIVDVVIFASTHINLGELEADKNTTGGGILRQCLRLACTVTVKNCLVIRALAHRNQVPIESQADTSISVNDFPKDMFDSYQGCSLLSANGLFQDSSLSLENTDLIANVEFSPHQTPNTSSEPSLLPFQSTPIKDSSKLLQVIDISRIQACIYHDFGVESRQAQFLALSSLYFISVLMVSKYRDIIEPKNKSNQKGKQSTTQQTSSKGEDGLGKGSGKGTELTVNNNNKIEITPAQSESIITTAKQDLTNILTSKLESTLESVCPLLKSIMCDFHAFLSKTLVGSHGQDLVNNEADRTFKRTNTSPVELVMLLCSQEWQNTLQKNAGLAFIELINEGRVLSHGMKDHIVRVAMEAEFILSRLRADDVAKHEQFSVACSQTQSARLHEEVLINSLISSAARRDYMEYNKFRETIQSRARRDYKLDIWEDDDRRKRRFVIDSCGDSHQQLYYSNSQEPESKSSDASSNDKTDTKRILDLQHTIELTGIDSHCSPPGADSRLPGSDELLNRQIRKDDDCDEEYFDEDDDDQARNSSNSPSSDLDQGNRANGEVGKKQSKANDDRAAERARTDIENQDLTSDFKANQVWDYDECGSVSDFTGSVIFAAECSLIWSIYAIPGVFQLTSHELYFEPNHNINEAIDMLKKGSQSADDSQGHESLGSQKSGHDQVTLRKIDLKVLRYCEFLTCNGKIPLNDIRAIFSRHYLLQPHALEIFIMQRTSVMFAFSDYDTVKRAVKYLPPVGVGIKYGIPQSRRASLMSPRQLFAASNMMQKWQKREIGNFQYLMFLNTIAGRTYQDFNQYPVFPWILTNYDSEELDLNLPSNFRDLSKPIGALNSKRRSEFIERYETWDNPKVPAFHYGTHYSTAAFTLNWLCRLRGPLNSAYLALQDGKYEESSRLFLSIGDSWVSSLTGGQQNVKELIPEFFYLPEMFRSNLGLPKVELPPWAKSAEQFVRLHRLALESELVSCQLHQWIDLIFGYKQRGPEAVNSVNTFYYLTYQGNVNLNMIQDPSLREAIESQIKHFGQTPSQLTMEPHPPRFSALHASPIVFSSTSDEINKVVRFPFKNPVVHIAPCLNNLVSVASSVAEGASTGSIPNPHSTSGPSSVLTITGNNQYQIHKWSPSEQSGSAFTIDPQLEQATSTVNRKQLIDVDDLCSNVSLNLKGYDEKDDIVEEVQWPCSHYIVTLDGRYIIMGSFYDNSFRVFSTEGGKLCQVIYGHRGPITCISRSEGNANADFHVATGSLDCSLLVWTWNERYAQIEGSGVSAVLNPLPKLTISGHQTAILSAHLCSELGLVISGSKNLILVNTTTSGENLLEINISLPGMLTKVHVDSMDPTSADLKFQRPYVKDKQKTLVEASMIGEDTQPTDLGKSKSLTSGRDNQLEIPNKFLHLSELCESEYYITNLQLARELAFIVAVALPPPKIRACKANSSSSGSKSGKNAAALIMTFNLKGNLMESTTIGQHINSPRLGDTCVLQVTRDGEHLILNDSPTSLKIYRTFDLQPTFAYNTNDIPNTLSDDQNRIRSLALLDHKFIVVGLDNGKLIIYNADFKNLH